MNICKVNKAYSGNLRTILFGTRLKETISRTGCLLCFTARVSVNSGQTKIQNTEKVNVISWKGKYICQAKLYSIEKLIQCVFSLKMWVFS